MLEGEFLFKRFGASAADYERAADEDTRLDLLDGVLIMHSPASVRHEDIFGFLLELCRGYVRTTNCGRVFGSRAPMILDDERRFEPDFLFVRTENLHRLGDMALNGPADAVVEIVSPATYAYDLGEKRDAYADAGIPEYWIIDPLHSRLLVDRPAGTRVADLTTGRFESAAIPGFWLDVAWLVADPLPDASAYLRTLLG
jgi:Uma2 family endonuclease